MSKMISSSLKKGYKEMKNNDPNGNEKRLSSISEYIKQYLGARKGLEELGVTRTKRNIEGDYAEWTVANKLNLKLAKNSIQQGYDALDQNGKKYQIKARENKNTTSFDIKDIHSEESKFDFLVCAFYSPEDLKITRLIQVPFEFVIENLRTNKSSFRFRWKKKYE
jgi:hypothetical protein